MTAFAIGQPVLWTRLSSFGTVKRPARVVGYSDKRVRIEFHHGGLRNTRSVQGKSLTPMGVSR